MQMCMVLGFKSEKGMDSGLMVCVLGGGAPTPLSWGQAFEWELGSRNKLAHWAFFMMCTCKKRGKCRWQQSAKIEECQFGMTPTAMGFCEQRARAHCSSSNVSYRNLTVVALCLIRPIWIFQFGLVRGWTSQRRLQSDSRTKRPSFSASSIQT